MLKDKVIIVTGGSRGIGAATAELLAAKGATVAVNYYQNQKAAEEVTARIVNNGGSAIAIQADARDEEEMTNLCEQTASHFGRIDALINNAGMSFTPKDFASITWEEFIQKTNDELKAAFSSTKAVLPYMKQQQYGRLVYISSGLSNEAVPGFISNGTSKGALNSYVRYIAQEFAKDGITANTVSPGMTETDATAGMPVEMKEIQASMIPAGRIAKPIDIARAAAFFASEESEYMTGIYVPVSGGDEMNS